MRYGRIGFWYRLAVGVLRPLAILLTRREWVGFENLPTSGGVIVAANHISHADPITIAHALLDNGRVPRFLAKAELFSMPVVGWVMRGAAQIPVYRDTPGAAGALVDAIAALRRGECVVIYPEGTTTRDPDRWPMQGRSGVARLALLSGAPVVPLAQWGAQRLHDKRDGIHVRRVAVRTLVGPPVDLRRFEARPMSAEVLQEATAAVMESIRRLVGELRGERVPERVWDPRDRRYGTAENERRTA